MEIWLDERPLYNNSEELKSRSRWGQTNKGHLMQALKADVAEAAKAQHPGGVDEPVYVELRLHWPAERETYVRKDGVTGIRPVAFPDVDAITYASKWILDGLTAGGMWSDDDRRYVRACRFEEHTVDGRAGLSILLIPAPFARKPKKKTSRARAR